MRMRRRTRLVRLTPSSLDRSCAYSRFLVSPGCPTTGSSEAIQLAGLAMKRQWQERMRAAGKDGSFCCSRSRGQDHS